MDVPRAANRAAHLAGIGLGLPLHLLSRIVVTDARPTPEQIKAVRKRRMDMVDRDLDNARRGLYPMWLVFDRAALRDARVWPLALRDFLTVRDRRDANAWQLEAPGVKDYPPYYRRRFHWQKDGYLSARSARRYDLGVELLFLGAADTMRRQAFPPLLEGLRQGARVLDVGCGTGRTLQMLSEARPDLALTGVDLSPYYASHARKIQHPNLSIVVGNAEQLPFPDGWFDAVTSTFLFHELPRMVRRQVMSEMVRVCRPGGVVVVCDAAQFSDAAELGPLLTAFHQSLHEPFFADHLKDPIEGYATASGLEAVRVGPAYVAKVVSGRTGS